MRLLEHFKELSLHPKNSEELKGLILQLAVQGKLTASWRAENSNIESAAVLFHKIQEEKTLLIKQKKISKEKPLEPLNQREIVFNLPEKWVWSRLGDLGKAQTGTTPSTKNPNNYGNYIPFLGPADISNSSIQYPIEGLSKEGLENGRLIDSDSLMMVCIGGSMGKCNITRKDVSCNQQINIIKPLCSPVDYIKIICQSPYFQDEVWDRSTGTATPMINKNKWLHIPVPVPPIEEQKAIVEVVNTLFEEVEQLESLTKERLQLKESFVISALARLTEAENTQQEWNFLQQHFSSFFTKKKNIKSLRETILQLALQGKLTANWRENNKDVQSASDLIDAVSKLKDQFILDKKIRKDKVIEPVREKEIPYVLPINWKWCRLNEFATLINGDRGKNYPSKAHYVDSGIPFITAGNLGERYLKHENFNYITEERFSLLRSGQVEKDDILYCLRGSLGKCAIVEGIDLGAIASSLCIIRIVDGVMPDFLLSYFMSPLGTQMILRHDNGTAQPNLSATDVKTYLFPLPPIEEQKAIVEKVNSLMALCDELEQQIETSNIQIEQLMQSCVAEALA